MNNETIIICIVAFLLGMLITNMLKNICGCKTIEGAGLGDKVVNTLTEDEKNSLNNIVDNLTQDKKKFLNDIYEKYREDKNVDNYLKQLENKIPSLYKIINGYRGLIQLGWEDWGKECATFWPLPSWCEDRSKQSDGGGEMKCKDDRCKQTGCRLWKWIEQSPNPLPKREAKCRRMDADHPNQIRNGSRLLMPEDCQHGQSVTASNGNVYKSHGCLIDINWMDPKIDPISGKRGGHHVICDESGCHGRTGMEGTTEKTEDASDSE